MKKARLDALLVERGLADDLDLARAIIMSGKVFAKGERVDKAGTEIGTDVDIEIRGKQDYVSRGGQKLKKALEHFEISPQGKVCIDCGASTGGFTDCLLQNGARLVYAIDVGYGQLAWSIRSDPRVVPMERTNIRYVTPEMLDSKPQLAVIDVSFISLGLVLPVVRELLARRGDAICLIKPQFETGRENVGSKGVVTEAKTHIEVLETFVESAVSLGYAVGGLTFSPIKGAQGNMEYLGWLGFDSLSHAVEPSRAVNEAHEYFSRN